MRIHNPENEIDFYIDKRWIHFRAGQTKNLEERFVIKILERFAHRRFEMDKKDIAYVTKTENEVTIFLKSGKKIIQRKPEELKYEGIMKKIDSKKFQIGIFVKNITSHYSGGRYWAWLLGHILVEDPRVQVTLMTNVQPSFGKSFDPYDKKNLFYYIVNPRNLFRMGERITKNFFDCVVGIPIEGGVSAQAYASQWMVPLYTLLFESPNFIRDYRTGPDAQDSAWIPYRSAMQDSVKVINNTEIGKKYLDEWLEPDWEPEKSVWLWNSVNTKVADEVKQKENNISGVYHLLFVGRMIGFKRIIHIIRALNLIRGNKFVLHIISGHGGNMLNQMQSEAKEHIQIEFHQRIDDYEKFQLIKMSNMMIFLSSFEGFGMPPMEALYCKRLCIAYPLPILKLIYKNHLVYAKNGDINDLAKVIEKWLPDSKKKKQHIKEAKEYIDKVSDHNRVRDEFFNIIELEKGVKNKSEVEPYTKIVNTSTGLRRLSFGMILCNGEQFVAENLAHIYDYADEIIIIEGAVKNYEKIIGSFSSTDKSLELVRQFKSDKDPENKIKLFTSKTGGRAWIDKKEMQNVLAENTHGSIYIKQDVDEFFVMDELMREINRLESEPNKLMINYRSYHFWGDLSHVIVGANFNDKQTRVWKWKPTYRFLRTFNCVTDTANNSHLGPVPVNSFVSEDVLFHYSYLYNNKARSSVLKYYTMRNLGDHRDVSSAWVNKTPSMLKEGRMVKEIHLKHPVDLEAFA